MSDNILISIYIPFMKCFMYSNSYYYLINDNISYSIYVVDLFVCMYDFFLLILIFYFTIFTFDMTTFDQLLSLLTVAISF